MSQNFILKNRKFKQISMNTDNTWRMEKNKMYFDTFDIYRVLFYSENLNIDYITIKFI